MRYSDAELEELLNNTESDLAERKEAWQGDAPDKGLQAVCAFANDLPDHRRPGVLFVGARDDGSPSNLSMTDELLRTLADVKTDGQILPPPTLLVEKRCLKGTVIAVVTVQPADAPPVRYRGRIWIRLGPRRGIATAQDERILTEKRRYRDLPFDAREWPHCPLTDLSRTLFEEEYLPGAFAPEILAANDRTYEQRLAACKMIVAPDVPFPTVTGILTLARNPRAWLGPAYVQFLRFAGTQWSDPIVDEALCEGSLSALIRRLDDKLDSHNRTAVDITSGPVEKRTSLYPRAALQQLVRNAVMHRTYEGTNAPARVSWFEDRIEVANPGGPFGGVTAENFGQPGVTDYRNPNLSDAMRVLGLVQRFGIGIQTAQAELQHNGNPPAQFIVTPTHVTAIVRRPPV
ncbi:MAG: transcriptional regulator [Verrucomicrobia bacterium]|nr:transcriptional regulator [Verrucomicrobiota bacterium]